TRVTTHGADGIRIESQGAAPLEIPVVPPREIVDPTGVGDGFRSGFLGATSWGLSPQRSAQVGATLATLVLEADGPQEYAVVPAEFTARLGEVYGRGAAGSRRRCSAAARPAPRRSEGDRVDGGGDLRGDPAFDEDPVPDHEHQQRPQLAAVVVRSGAVVVEH